MTRNLVSRKRYLVRWNKMSAKDVLCKTNLSLYSIHSRDYHRLEVVIITKHFLSSCPRTRTREPTSHPPTSPTHDKKCDFETIILFSPSPSQAVFDTFLLMKLLLSLWQRQLYLPWQLLGQRAAYVRLGLRHFNILSPRSASFTMAGNYCSLPDLSQLLGGCRFLPCLKLNFFFLFCDSSFLHNYF